jgi:TatD DNase family protein
MQFIDSHVHLNFDSFQSDLDQVAQNWRNAGVSQLVHSCCTPAEFPQLQAVADQYPEVSLAVGLHPLEAKSWSEAVGLEIRQWASQDPRVVAIGETGLDFYKSEADTVDQQKEAFRYHLAIAQELDRAVIVHCREAAVATREILDEMDPNRNLRIVMHCWSGTPEETRLFVELGCWISFSGIVTFRSAKTVHQSVFEVPADRLLIETDCPFLAPTPHRGQRNEPAYVIQVAQTLAQLRQESLDSLAKQTTENACTLFRLPLTF